MPTTEPAEAPHALRWYSADVRSEPWGTVLLVPRERANSYRVTADEADTLAAQLKVEAAAARARARAESPREPAPELPGISA